MPLVTKETGSVICNTMIFLLADESTSAILRMFNYFFISGSRVFLNPFSVHGGMSTGPSFAGLSIFSMFCQTLEFLMCCVPILLVSREGPFWNLSLLFFPPFPIASLSFLSHCFHLHWHIAPTQSYQSFLLSSVQGGFGFWGRNRKGKSSRSGLQIEHLQVNQTLGVRRLNSCSPSSCTSFCSLGFSATTLFYSLSCLLTSSQECGHFSSNRVSC